MENKNFISSLKKESNRVYKTYNEAVTLGSTLSPIVDFVSVMGSLRNQSEDDIIHLFTKSYLENKELTIAALLYLRNIRNQTLENVYIPAGLGERRAFRVILDYLISCKKSENDVIDFKKLLSIIPTFGRWDDIFFNASLLVESFPVLEKVIKKYLNKEKLDFQELTLFKWLPSINASNRERNRLGNLIRKRLNLTPKEYRKMLKSAREDLSVVEQKMCSNNWDNIIFSKVPSKAMLIYRNAFIKHTPEKFAKYLDDVKSGKVKINAGTLYPYEIFSKVRCSTPNEIDSLQVLWDNLENYVASDFPVLVVADTSGSMDSFVGNTKVTCMDVSLSLALYFSERNKNEVFKNKFITFSSNPEFQEIPENANLLEKLRIMEKAHWELNTDIQAVFDLILTTAINNNIKNKDLPKAILIISDMEFDSCCKNRTNFEIIKEKFNSAGYDLPLLIFWDVNGRLNNYPVLKDDGNTVLLSGYGSSVFGSLTAILKEKNINPELIVKNVILKPYVEYVRKIKLFKN